jgi:hypothetical protein
MASKIDISGLTLNPEEASNMSELIIEKELVNGVLSTVHDVVTGIEHKKQIPFVGHLVDSLKKATDCTPGEGGDIALTEKFWDPEIFDSRWTHCAADLDKLLKLFQKAKRINPDFYDRVTSKELGVVMALIGMMLRDVLPKKVWFSDKAADVVGNGGNFTAGTDLALYNVIDGLWKQIFAEITAGSTYHVNISANEGSSKAAQVLSADEAYDTFVEMYETADPRLLEADGVQFLVTKSMADNYRATLRTKSLNNGYIDDVTKKGRKVLAFEDIPIVIMYGWDRTIKADQDLGSTYNLPNRAVMTVPGNIPVGTLSEKDFEELDSFYDRTLKSNIIDFAMSLDTKFLEDYMAVVAY